MCVEQQKDHGAWDLIQKIITKQTSSYLFIILAWGQGWWFMSVIPAQVTWEDTISKGDERTNCLNEHGKEKSC